MKGLVGHLYHFFFFYNCKIQWLKSISFFYCSRVYGSARLWWSWPVWAYLSWTCSLRVVAWPKAGYSGMASFSCLTVDWLPAGARRRLDHTSLASLQASLGLFTWAEQGSKKASGSGVARHPVQCILPKQITGPVQIQGVGNRFHLLMGWVAQLLCKGGRYRETWRTVIIHSVNLPPHCKTLTLSLRDAIKVCRERERSHYSIYVLKWFLW